MRTRQLDITAGLCALVFAVSPALSWRLLALWDLWELGGPTARIPVGDGLAPAGLIWAFYIAGSVPWIGSGVLLLWHQIAGRRLALILTLPTACVVLAAGVDGLSAAGALWYAEHNSDGLRSAFLTFPLALSGAGFCVSVWLLQRRGRRAATNRLQSRHTPGTSQAGVANLS